MENATAFSPPYTRVNGRRWPTPASAPGSAVVDHGIGHERGAARRGERPAHPARAARPGPDRGARPVRGRPAGPPARLQVRLAPTPGGGITASVDIGPHLLVSGPATAHAANAPAPGSFAADRRLPPGPHAGAAVDLPPNDKAVAWAAAVTGQLAGVDVDAIDRASRTLSTGSSLERVRTTAGVGRRRRRTAGRSRRRPLASENDDRPAATRQGAESSGGYAGAQSPVGVSPPNRRPAHSRQSPLLRVRVSSRRPLRLRPPTPPAAVGRRRLRWHGAVSQGPRWTRARRGSSRRLALTWAGRRHPTPTAARALIEQFEDGVATGSARH